MNLGWRIIYHGHLDKDREPKRMATIGTVALEIKSFNAGRSFAGRSWLWKCGLLGAMAVTAPILTRMHVFRIFGHGSDLEHFALLYGKFPNR
jgi:hypothetical protein